MIVGEREVKAGSSSYRRDNLYPFAKAFVEAANDILAVESFDIFAEPQRALRNNAVRQNLKDFFVENYVDESSDLYTVEEIEGLKEEASVQFDNDIKGIQENTYQMDYSPMVGMALPIHKLILMNNVFSQGGGIQKATATKPSFTISLERRILVTPDGREIDMFLEQNSIADAIDSSLPTTEIEIKLPHTEDKTDIIGVLGGTSLDSLSTESYISGIYIENVYFAEGDVLPDADGWFSTKGKVAEAEDAGTRNVWYHVNIGFTPNYGGPNHLERALTKAVSIKYKKNAAGDIEVLNDTLFGSLDKNKLQLTTINSKITKVKFTTRLNASNAMHEEPSVKWKIDSDYVEIPEARPINTTVSPEEVKDIAAMYDANQVTKIMSITKSALSEYKDKSIKNFLDADYKRMDERTSFSGSFDFAPPEGYALDWVTFRQQTFMDYLDDFATRMLQVLNDPNMTVTVYGDPRIVRKITPSEYTYQSPAQIGPVRLDYTQTVVNTRDNRVYNFVGSDKLRNTNELMIILNPQNSDRICYRIYDYQLYISNEIRNAANPALPAIHSFERWKIINYQATQGRIQILHPSGRLQGADMN